MLPQSSIRSGHYEPEPNPRHGEKATGELGVNSVEESAPRSGSNILKADG